MAVHRVEDAYRRLHPRLWHALLAFAGDGDLASDAESEAFTQALARGDEVRDVDAWVWRTAFRVAAGLLKNRNSVAIELRDETTTAHRHMVEDSSVVEFISLLGDLSDQQRAVVVMRYIGAFRTSEIAELLDTTPGTVRVQLHRAHTQLRQSLEVSDAR